MSRAAKNRLREVVRYWRHGEARGESQGKWHVSKRLDLECVDVGQNVQDYL